MLALGLIGIALAVHWFDRDGLRQSSGEPVTFTDILYFTMITVTTVGYGDIVPVTQQSRLFDTFVVTPIRLFVWLIFTGTAYDFLLKRVWERWRMSVIQRQLRDHVVIAGFGNSGSEAASELIRRGAHPDMIVVIDESPAALRNAEALDVAVMEGNATRDAALRAVRVGTAVALIVAAGRDDTSILIVLTARRIAPTLPISVIIRSLDNEAIARQAGPIPSSIRRASPACFSPGPRTAHIWPTIWRIWRQRMAGSRCVNGASRRTKSVCRCGLSPPALAIAFIVRAQ